MFYKQEFGIDLGTDTIKIYDKREDSVITEKNLIAIRGDSELVAVGSRKDKRYQNDRGYNTFASVQAEALYRPQAGYLFCCTGRYDRDRKKSICFNRKKG